MIEIIVNNNSTKKITTFLNPFSYLVVRKHDISLEFFNIEIDGGLLSLIFNLFGISCTRRSFDMTSLAPKVFQEAIKNNKSVYFIGTKPTIIDLSIKNIKTEFPNLNISGYHHGYIHKKDQSVIFDSIKYLQSDYVICGMGTPMQANFLLDLQKNGWDGIGYTCGGFLHQTANDINYYPNWINKLSLRFLYRMYDEPKLIKRYFIDYPKAILIIIYDLIKYKLR